MTTPERGRITPPIVQVDIDCDGPTANEALRHKRITLREFVRFNGQWRDKYATPRNYTDERSAYDEQGSGPGGGRVGKRVIPCQLCGLNFQRRVADFDGMLDAAATRGDPRLFLRKIVST